MTIPPPPRQSAIAEALSSLSPLKRDEIAAYINYIDDAVDNALCLINGLGNIRWQPVKQKADVVISRAADDVNSLSNQSAVRTVCTVNASFDEMMDHLITETTEVFREREAALYGAEFLDGAVLHVLHPRDFSSEYTSQRFVCIKWHCLKAVAAPTKPRDYVYIELVDSFVDDQNVRVGLRLSKSIDLYGFPSLEESHRFVRAKTFTLHTFHSLDSNSNPTSRASVLSNGSSSSSPLSSFQVELRSMILGDHAGKLPAWVVNKMSDLAALRGQCIRDYFEQMRLSTLQWVPPHHFVPASKRSFCVICTRGFSLVRKKYNCQACGEVVCNQCSLVQLIGPKRTKTRVCVWCNIQARSTALQCSGSTAAFFSNQSIASRPSSAGSFLSPHNNNSMSSRPSNSLLPTNLRGSSSSSMASTARASDKLSSDGPSYNHSQSHPDWQNHHYVAVNPNLPTTTYRRSQSEMYDPMHRHGSFGPSTTPTSTSHVQRDSNGRISDNMRFTTSTTRTSVASNASTRPSTNANQDSTLASDMEQAVPPREGLDLGVSHIKQTAISIPTPPSSLCLLDMNVSIVQPQTNQDLGRLSEALSDVTVRNSDMSERMSELDVDAYDDDFHHRHDVVAEECDMNWSSFVDALAHPVHAVAPIPDDNEVDDDGRGDDDVDLDCRPSHLAAEDYLEATRMTLAEIDRGMTSVKESVHLTAAKLEEQEQGVMTRMSIAATDFQPPPSQPLYPRAVSSVMDTPPDVENLFVVLKLNADIDRLQHKMETVQEGTIQLNQVNEAMNEKIHTLEKVESEKAIAVATTSPDETSSAVVVPPTLMDAMDRINENFKQLQHQMERVQETSTKVLDVKLADSPVLPPPPSLVKESSVESTSLHDGVPPYPESSRGGFVSFLEDSSFTPAAPTDADDNHPEGWTSVHSKVSGKMYYYNPSCGKTSWTMPEEDDMAATNNYVVL
ncbi:hypothetical protein H310_02203 [Aphanomyces invadans]|uniref:FYVE-type domain-containing protein n=1 Tax=Aphanomyces invadans TaxID=157072 RepID=A0A024UPJ0_9STRA|nr:hypothetical protein H310_02203 [Aphanomyces invadans]ETW07762.1 hypothetical protein H310_02203 [Aphanomyces invadans]|eukprot:XP_008863855.1 hypothetical protein H310_02203 [Aphanomyces invadans]